MSPAYPTTSPSAPPGPSLVLPSSREETAH
jgi:hypothetical protein